MPLLYCSGRMHLGRVADPNWGLASPLYTHGLSYQRAHSRRVRPATNRHKVDQSPKLRLDERARDYTRIGHGIFRHKSKPQSRLRHRHDPVVALATVDHVPRDSIAEELAGITVEFAIHTIEVVGAIEVPRPNRVAFWEGMTRRQ